MKRKTVNNSFLDFFWVFKSVINGQDRSERNAKNRETAKLKIFNKLIKKINVVSKIMNMIHFLGMAKAGKIGSNYIKIFFQIRNNILKNNTGERPGMNQEKGWFSAVTPPLDNGFSGRQLVNIYFPWFSKNDNIGLVNMTSHNFLSLF